MTQGRQVRRWTSARVVEATFDYLPSAVLAVAAAHEQLYNSSDALTWVMAQTLVWSLVLRRRFPLPVLAFTLAVAAAGWVSGQVLFAHLGVLVALHAVAASRSRRVSVTAAAVVELGALAVALRFAPTGSSNDALVLLTGLAMSALLLGTSQRTQRHYVAALTERTHRLELEQTHLAEIAAAEERARIAREMHDIVAHSVAVMIALSDGAAAIAPHDPQRSARSMEQVATTGREALAELRKVLSVLRPHPTPGSPPPESRTPQPGLAELSALVDDVTRTGLAVHLDLNGDASAVSQPLQTTLFRVVQEALTNTLKHAPTATRSDVRVWVQGHRLLAQIEDDGGAVTTAAPTGLAATGSGHGLRGMAERAAVHNGTLRAGSTGRGWLVELSAELAVEAAR